MPFLPTLQIGLLNGWLLMLIYLLCLIGMVLTFPAQVRHKLFYEPAYPRGDPRWFIILFGRVAAITFVILMIFSSLQIDLPIFYVGIGIYLLGFIIVMVSLWTFRLTPAGQIVDTGIYRISRNPQWVGLVLVFIGTATTTAAWLPFILLAVLFFAYHFQILLEEGVCSSVYGVDYHAYMHSVPRYLFF